MIIVRSSLDHKVQHQQLVLVDFIRWIEQEMDWVGELSDISDLNEIFKKLHPYFDFLDCELIVDMSERFLNDEYFGDDNKCLISELKEHMIKADALCCSTTVKDLKNQLKSIYLPHLANLSNMPQIHIELNNKWNEATIERLYLLIKHLLPHKSKQSILKYIEIETGSVRIKYIVHELNADCLIAYAQSKLQFIQLIGIFVLTINGEHVLKEDENMNFTFESALLKAANSGHDEAVQFLLKLGGDVDHCNEEGSTALMLASKGGHEEVVQTLVSAGANVNIQDNEGFTALIIACEHNYYVIFSILLQAGANPNLQIIDGSNALMIASYYGYYNIVTVLIEQQTEFNNQRRDGVTCLMLASHNGHTQVVELLLKGDAIVNIQADNGWTALMLASQNGHTQVAQLLLKENPDVNIQAKNRWTALMLASQNGHTHVAELLLKADADVNIQGKNGVTAIMQASKNGHTHVVELLLKADADVNIQAKNEWTALMLASQNGHTEVVELLVKELVDIDAKEKNGVTALMLACYNGHVEVAECLLQSHADPHILRRDGSTAFSLAAYSGNRDLVNMLLDKAEPTTDEIEKAIVTSCYGGHPTLITFLSNKLPHLTNDQRELLDSCVKGDLGVVIMKTLDSPDIPLVLGLTPLMVASSCGHVDIVDVVIQAGANVNEPESHLGFTPLFFAIRGGKSASIIETLLMYGASPNITATTNETPLDVAISIGEMFEMNDIIELLIKYGGQTTLQSQERKKSKSSLLTFDELQATRISLQAIEDTSYNIRRKTNQSEIPSFTSFII